MAFLYKIVKFEHEGNIVDDDVISIAESRINRMGMHGWELIEHYHHNNHYSLFFFKRIVKGVNRI